MACCGSGVESSVVNQAGSPAMVEPKVDTKGEKPPTSASTTKGPEAAVASSPTPGAESTPVPEPAPVSANEQSIPEASGLVPTATPNPQTNVSVREEPNPGWATAEKGNVGTTASAESPVTTAPGARPAKSVPAGYVSGTRKDQEISSGVQDRIAGLKASGLATQNTGGKRMKTPRIITDTKESWDREGNITRELTRYITEPDGTKRTEKETIYIRAAEAQQAQQQ